MPTIVVPGPFQAIAILRMEDKFSADVQAQMKAEGLGRSQEIFLGLTFKANIIKVQALVTSMNTVNALTSFNDRLTSFTSKLNIPPTALMSLEVREEVDEPDNGDIPELAGTAELADILGVSKSRACQISVKKDFPTPLFNLKATRVWDSADVAKYAETQRH